MNVRDFVANIVNRFNTNDVFQIAEKVCVKIVYESWNLTTIGEFDRRTKTITVNLRALKDGCGILRLEEMIIAHELGHFFALDLGLNQREEETFAREFAAILTKTNE